MAIFTLLYACSSPQDNSVEKSTNTIENPTNHVVLSSEIIWEKLNPARGDQSPQAGTLWGDRKGSAATGFLAKFVDGFSSPPHIHNVTYRAAVIKGSIHNDDPNAANMWMKPGSFWTQPAGESHITSAQGEENIALVEINNGPYLVKPPSEAFDNGERPINIDRSNIVWLNNEMTDWVNSSSDAEISILLDNQKNNGLRSLFIKLPASYKGEIKTDGTILHSVVIKGELQYTLPQNNIKKTLDAGSYFGATDRAVHIVANTSEEEAIIYVRTNGQVIVD